MLKDQLEKSLKTNGSFKFYINATFKATNLDYVDDSAKIKIEADTFWSSNKITSSETTLSEASSWDTDHKFTQKTITLTVNKYFPSKPLPLVKLTQRDYHVYIKLSFDVNLPRDGQTKTYVEYLKITPKQWQEML